MLWIFILNTVNAFLLSPKYLVNSLVPLHAEWPILGISKFPSLLSPLLFIDHYIYRQVSNIRRTLVGNKIVDHSDVVGASPVGAAPTTSSFSA